METLERCGTGSASHDVETRGRTKRENGRAEHLQRLQRLLGVRQLALLALQVLLLVGLLLLDLQAKVV